jgi:hypothetical protein
MAKRTSELQREACYRQHLAGETYAAIAQQMGLSREWVRYWCRRQRDGGDAQTRYRREPTGLLSRFDPKVRYVILRLRLQHPRWGPGRIVVHLKKRPSLQGKRLPKEAQVGRYLHQWPRFCRKRQARCARERLDQPIRVHQRWQFDFKMGIALGDGSQVNLHTVWEPVGEACLEAVIGYAGRVGQAFKKVTAAEAQTTLRRCFAHWHTLPEQVQTDNETTFVGQPQGDFPSRFTLWLVGLDIEHALSRPGQPTDNAEVERGHRTLNDYAIVGNQQAPAPILQNILDQSVHELACELPSRAPGCAGRPPLEAHPDLLQSPRPFRPEWELALFDLRRVYAYLATFTWQRTVGKTGQVELGGHRYTVGRPYARRQVPIHFDPADHHFVFCDPDRPEIEIKRRPALGLDVVDLTGLVTWPVGLGPQQLPLFSPEQFEGVCC